MINFVQDTKNDLNMYAKFGYFTLCIFVIKYSKIWFMEILYKTIMHKNEFGQACKDILKRTPNKFILHF